LPAIGVVLPSGSQLRGGTFSADLSISGRTDALVIAGPVRLANAKLDGFDLGSKLSAVPALAGKTGKDTTLQNLSMTVRTAPEITQANAINVTIPSLGTVAGTGTIGPSAVLNFDLKADLANRSGSGVPFRIEGTASDPKFVADVKAIAGGAIARKVTGGESPRSTALARRRR